MITAGQFKKGVVITFEGAHWIVEDYHVQKTAQRRPVLQTKLRHMKTGHVVDRSFDEADRFEQPEVQSRTYQFLYADRADYVFVDMETFDQITVPAEVVGAGKWLLKEGTEFVVPHVEASHGASLEAAAAQAAHDRNLTASAAASQLSAGDCPVVRLPKPASCALAIGPFKC